MEFIMEKEINEIIPKTVGFNYEELKRDLATNLSKYQNMVVTEETTKDARTDRAKLNKLRATIDRNRIDIKKEWNKPYVEFENKVKDLISMIDKPIDAIDGQIKVYEDKKREQKQADVKAIYSELIDDLKDIVPYERIHQASWLNAGSSLKMVRSGMADIISAIRTDLSLIQLLEVECEELMIDTYLNSGFSMADAMAEKTRWEKEIIKLKAYREKKKADKEKNKAIVAKEEFNQCAPAPKPELNIDIDVDQKNKAEDAIYEELLEPLDFRVYVNREQMIMLRDFLKQNKIKFGRVPNGTV